MTATTLWVNNPTSPTIRRIAPPSASPGVVITITGAGFDPTAVVVEIGDKPAEVTAATRTSIRARMPDVPVGVRELRVTSAGVLIGSDRFRCLAPRLAVAKPPVGPVPQIRPGGEESVLVKFHEGYSMRSSGGALFTQGSEDLSPLRTVLEAFGVDGRTHAMFVGQNGLPTESANTANNAALQEQSGTEVADLNLWFRIDTHDVPDIAGLLQALNALESVELATVSPQGGDPLADCSGSTPSTAFAALQFYRNPAPVGVGSKFFNDEAGGDGTGVRYYDIEADWLLTHEDLPEGLEFTAPVVLPACPDPPFTGCSLSQTHGLASIGVVGARENLFGMTGIAPGTDIRVSSTASAGDRPALAVFAALLDSSPGDVLHWERHERDEATTVCTVGGVERDFAPVECSPVLFDVNRHAVGLGRVVVLAAGNGDLDLDDPVFNVCTDPLSPATDPSELLPCFDRDARDSGAIYAGAGAPDDGSGEVPAIGQPARSRLSFSNFGSRLDLQGWGEFVPTLGLEDVGDLQITTSTTTFTSSFYKEERGWVPTIAFGNEECGYINGYGGTSSGSAIVAGSAVALQGRARAFLSRTLTPQEMLDILRRSGTPQQMSDSTIPVSDEKIGPQPDLVAANEILEDEFIGGRIVSVFDLPVGESHSLEQLIAGDFDSDGDLDFAMVDPHLAAFGDPSLVRNVHVAFGPEPAGIWDHLAFNSGGFFNFGITPVSAGSAPSPDFAVLNTVDDADPAQSSINLFAVLPPDSFTKNDSLKGVGSTPTSIITSTFRTCGVAQTTSDIAWTSADEVHVVLGGVVFPTGQVFDLDGEETIPIPTSPGLRLDKLVAGDFDSDGCMDIVVAARSVDAPGDRSGELYFLRGAGSGGPFPGFFTPEVIVPLSPDLLVLDMRATDVDADGNLDLVMVRKTDEVPTPSALTIIYGTSDPSFPFGLLHDVPSRLCCDAPGIDVGDVNDDGFLDIVVANSGEPLGTQFSRPGIDVFLGCGPDRDFRVVPLPHGGGLDFRASDVLVRNVDADAQLELVYTTSHRFQYFDPISFPDPQCPAP